MSESFTAKVDRHQPLETTLVIDANWDDSGETFRISAISETAELITREGQEPRWGYIARAHGFRQKDKGGDYANQRRSRTWSLSNLHTAPLPVREALAGCDALVADFHAALPTTD